MLAAAQRWCGVLLRSGGSILKRAAVNEVNHTMNFTRAPFAAENCGRDRELRHEAAKK